MSLFGKSAATPAGASTSLGGSVLLGSTDQQRPLGASLFAPATSQSAAPPAARTQSGLFGTSAARPSLFGTSTTTTQSAPTAGLFASSTAQPSAPPAGFQSRQTQPPVQQPPAQAQPTAAYFDSLLAKSRKQADGESALETLPTCSSAWEISASG